jgi:glycosyltransferase involved in cell wall biosynthesis
MARQTPAISVVLPVRNGMPYLPGAIDSVLKQTRGDFELIVIDDGSIDGTTEYLRSVTDSRLRVVGPEGSGLAEALNAGLAIARAPFVARQDADDRSAPERFARQLAFLDAHPDVTVLATCAKFIDDDEREVENVWTRTVRDQQDAAQTPDEIRSLMPLTCCITHGSVLMRTDAVRARGGYHSTAVPAEDYDLWLRLLPDHQIAKLPDRLYEYRVHEAQSSVVRRLEQTRRVLAAKLQFLRRQVPGLPWPARLALPCDDRGAALLREVGPPEGFDAEPWENTGSSDGADVIVVTDFAAVPRFAAAITLSGDYVQFGNMFVRRHAR